MSGESWGTMAERARARDLADMRRALRFSAAMLRAELGEGGAAEEHERAGVEFAVQWLEGTADRGDKHPNIPLHQWRRSADGTTADAARRRLQLDEAERARHAQQERLSPADQALLDDVATRLGVASSEPAAPGPCPSSTTGALAGDVYRCELRAGHAGDHEAQTWVTGEGLGTYRVQRSVRWPDITPKASFETLEYCGARSGHGERCIRRRGHDAPLKPLSQEHQSLSGSRWLGDWCERCGVSAAPGEPGHATLCPSRARHGYTSHGHACCPKGNAVTPPTIVTMCGGGPICKQCDTEAAAMHRAAVPPADPSGPSS